MTKVIPELIVTTHKGLVDWLHESGIEAPVICRAQIKQVIGKRVYGSLPLRIAAYAHSIVMIEMPRMSNEAIDNKRDLTAQEMDDYGAEMVEYTVTRKKFVRKERETNQALLGRDEDGWELL